MTKDLATGAEQHLAYPVLHYYHSRTRATAAPLALAHLDEMLFLLQEIVDEGARPEAAAVAPTRRAVDRYLEAVMATSSMPVQVDGPPPLPDVSVIRSAGIPVVDEAHLRMAAVAAADRRRSLATMVASDGWTW